MEKRYGGPGTIGRIIARGRVDSLKREMASNPAGLYHKIFAGKAGPSIPFMTRLHMLNEAPLAALGWGPKSWREAALAKRQRTVLSNEAKKSIAGMAIG